MPCIPGAQHDAGRVDIHSLGLHGATEAPVEWRGEPHEHVSDIVPGRDATFAFTAGRSCATRRAVLVSPRHSQGVDAIDVDVPSRAVGWLDHRVEVQRSPARSGSAPAAAAPQHRGRR